MILMILIVVLAFVLMPPWGSGETSSFSDSGGVAPSTPDRDEERKGENTRSLYNLVMCKMKTEVEKFAFLPNGQRIEFEGEMLQLLKENDLPLNQDELQTVIEEFFIEQRIKPLEAMIERGEANLTMETFCCLSRSDRVRALQTMPEKLLRVGITPENFEEIKKETLQKQKYRIFKTFIGGGLNLIDTNVTDGRTFENMVHDACKNNGFELEHLPKSGDQGADVLGVYSGYKIAIQCKAYSGSVGNGAVQEVISAQRFYSATVGLVVTNSHFTDSAIALAKRSGVLLVDESLLNEFLKGPGIFVLNNMGQSAA